MRTVNFRENTSEPRDPTEDFAEKAQVPHGSRHSLILPRREQLGPECERGERQMALH